MSRIIMAMVIGLAALTIITQESAAQGNPPTIQTNPPWEGSVAVGLTVTRGNSETLLFTANAAAQKKTKQYEISLGADGTYGETTDQETDEKTRNAASAHGFGQYNYLFTDKFYGYARLDALHDAVANVHYRITVGPGAGYYFIKNPKTRLSGEVGPGYVIERLHDDGEDGVDDSRDHDEDYMTIRFAERFEHKFNDSVKMWQSVEFLPQIDLWRNYIINFEIGAEATLTKQLSLRVFAVDTYDNVPAEGRKKNDLKVVTALAYKF
jgi:putative salt-induced outer membrane protein YdiY